jgi:hypothetical protein
MRNKGVRLKRGAPEKGQVWRPSFLLLLDFPSFLFPLLLLIYMTSGPFYGSHFFLVTFLIFFTLRCNNGLAALAVQCKNKTTVAQYYFLKQNSGPIKNVFYQYLKILVQKLLFLSVSKFLGEN